MSGLVSMRLYRPALRLGRGTALSLAVLATCGAAPASAAKIYRCGNAFQDQPCPDVKIAAALPVDKTPAPRDPGCAAAGRDPKGRADCTARVGRGGAHEIAIEAKR